MRNIEYDELVCPVCKSKLVFLDNEILCSGLDCHSNISNTFFKVGGVPVLIDFSDSVIERVNFQKFVGASVVNRNGSIKKVLKSLLLGETINTKKNVAQLKGLLENTKDPRILVIGGGTVGKGMDYFFETFKESLDSIDIYKSETVNLICDAHKLPFRSDVYDLVIIQAVLEHVVDPTMVVSECKRVLKIGGFIYAETPFMQQVHEGAYDFTRFTESGHRYLFKEFKRLNSGYLAGVGYSLLWSMDYFFSGVFRAKYVGKVIRILFFWLKYFDLIVPASFNIDGACAVFFLGTAEKVKLTPKEIVEHYKGNQK